MWIIIFNWYGMALVGGIGGGAIVVSLLLAWLLGVDESVVFAPVTLVAGILLLVLDFRARRRNGPFSPVWRLAYPRAGGHIFFVPCWVMGSFLIVVSVAGIVGILKNRWFPGIPDAVFVIGFLGFLIPPAYDFFAPFGLPWRFSAEPESAEPSRFRDENS